MSNIGSSDGEARQADLEAIAGQFDKMRADYEAIILDGLSGSDRREILGCTNLIRDQVIPALLDDPDIESRRLSRQTMEKLVAERRPPSGDREMSDFRNAIFFAAKRELRERSVGPKTLRTKAEASPKTRFLAAVFILTVVAIVVLELGLVRPSSNGIGRSVGHAIGSSLFGIAFVAFGMLRRRPLAGYLVSAIVANCIVVALTVSDSYREANDDMVTACQTSQARGGGDQSRVPAYCACVANEMTAPVMWVMGTTYLLGGTEQEAVRKVNDDSFSTPKALACQKVLTASSEQKGPVRQGPLAARTPALDAPVAQPVQEPESEIYLSPVSIVPGIQKVYTRRALVAPLSIETPPGANYFVKLVDKDTGELVMTMYAEGGLPLEVKAPLGRYRLKYASGRFWYGEKELFFKDTVAAEADADFDFRLENGGYSGYTVTLIREAGGNLQTNEIPLDQF